MALRVWLPLNGNLKNQGLSDLTFSNTNTTNLTIDTSGKIGSCYQRATKQTAGYITSDKTILLDNDITMCCWALVSDGIASANGLITNHNHSTNTGVGLTFKYISSTDFRISCNTGTGSERTYDTYYGITNIKDAWHHLALTYDNAAHQLLLYVDGIIECTLNNYINASQEDWIRLFEWSTNYDNTNYRPAVKLNDVRIYDECLSPKQIKEISKGLVVHYKLDAQIFENVHDVSGYLYNAQLSDNGIFEFDIDDDHSARHLKQLKFYDTASYIKLPQLNTSGFANSCTIVYWAKITDMNGRMAWGFSDGNRLNIYPTGSVICCNTGDGSSNPYQKNGVSVAFSQWNNGWHQFAMVIDNTTNKLYVDGVYQGTAKTYKAITGTQIYLSGWDAGTSYTWTGGQLSDFRIYATALSAEEILKLHENCGIIDNKNNIYAYDFREETVYVPV